MQCQFAAQVADVHIQAAGIYGHIVNAQQRVKVLTRHDTATLHEQEIAKANGVRMYTWSQPQQVLKDADGKVTGMRFEKTRMVDAKFAGTGATFDLAADAVFKAIGQVMDTASLSDPLANTIERKGDKISVDDHFRTCLPGIYAGGDCVAPGQDLTVQAVQHGNLAAHAIHHYPHAHSEAA